MPLRMRNICQINIECSCYKQDMNQRSRHRLVCAACGIGVPLAKRWTTTWALGTIGLAGGATTKKAGAAIASGLIGLAVGALIDAAAEPLCGRCSTASAAA